MNATAPSVAARMKAAREEPDAANAAPPDMAAAAMLRLAASRSRLRLAMLPPPPQSGSRPFGGSLDGIVSGLLDQVRALPLVNIVIEAVEDWWARHPLRAASHVAAEASRKLATPIALAHPLALVAGAAVIGALLALARPWRWLLRPALFAGLLPAVAARAVRELPVDALLSAFTAFRSPAARPNSQSGPRPPPAPERPGATGPLSDPALSRAPQTAARSLGETALYP